MSVSCLPSAPRAGLSSPAHATLLNRCVVQGADADWRLFLKRYARRLRAAIIHALRCTSARTCREDVDDLVQECYCRLFSLAGRTPNDRASSSDARIRGHSEGEVRRYLSCVARAVVVDFLRARSAAKRPRPEEGRSSLRLLTSLPAVQASPEERMLTTERLATLVRRCHRYFGARPHCPRTRAVLQALVDGHSSTEIAQASRGALTAQQVDSLVCRMRRRLAAEGIVLARRGAA